MKKINLTGIIIALIIAISVVSTTIFLVVTLLGNDKPDDSTQNNIPSDGYVDPDGWTDVD